MKNKCKTPAMGLKPTSLNCVEYARPIYVNNILLCIENVSGGMTGTSITKMLIETPNDADLGREIRKLANKLLIVNED